MCFFRRKPIIEWASMTNIGSRTVNEDSVIALNDNERFLFVVCDGLGGHGMGQEAANLVTEIFACEFANYDKTSNFLKNAFDKAQKAVLEVQSTKNLINKMKTTATALYIDKDRFYYGFIGDTRLYHYKNEKLLARTKDHTIAQMLVYSGTIKDEDIPFHEDRSRLLYVIGDKWDEVKYEITKQQTAKKGYSFLICTDGLWEVVYNPMPKKGQDAKQWIKTLETKIIKETAKKDDIDNYSAIAVLMR